MLFRSAVAAWLGQAGKNNKMFFIPMIFMLAATLTQLVLTIYKKIAAMAAGAQGAFFWAKCRSCSVCSFALDL